MKNFNSLDKVQQDMIVETVKDVINLCSSTREVFKETLENLPQELRGVPGTGIDLNICMAVNEFVFENVKIQLVNY
jgi:hypothetical protein